MSVDVSVPEGVPHTGILTSDQGMVSISGFDILKISRANMRLMNNVGVYRETGRRIGTTYVGNQRVTGQITRAFLNFAEHRFGLGVQSGALVGGQQIFNGPGVLTPTQIMGLIGEKDVSFPYNSDEDGNFYPLRCDLQFEINFRQLPITTTENGEVIADTEPGIQVLICKNALITNMVIAYDSRGLVTSGPLDFIGSAISWSGVK